MSPSSIPLGSPRCKQWRLQTPVGAVNVKCPRHLKKLQWQCWWKGRPGVVSSKQASCTWSQPHKHFVGVKTLSANNPSHPIKQTIVLDAKCKFLLAQHHREVREFYPMPAPNPIHSIFTFWLFKVVFTKASELQVQNWSITTLTCDLSYNYFQVSN